MKYYIIIIFIGLLFGCVSKCENKIENLNKEEYLEQFNGEYNVWEGSSSQYSLKKLAKENFEDYACDYGQLDPFKYIQLGSFDSLYYTYDSLGLEITYYRLSSCKRIIPVLREFSDSVEIKLKVIGLNQLECENGEIVLQALAESCKNVIRHYVKLDYDKVKGRKIVFKPYRDKSFEIVPR